MKRKIFILLALFLLQINVASAYGPSDPCYFWGDSCDANELNIYIKNSSNETWHVNENYTSPTIGHWEFSSPLAAHNGLRPNALVTIGYYSTPLGDGVSGTIELTNNKIGSIRLNFNQSLTFLDSKVTASSSDSNIIKLDWCKKAQTPVFGKKIPGMCYFSIS